MSRHARAEPHLAYQSLATLRAFFRIPTRPASDYFTNPRRSSHPGYLLARVAPNCLRGEGQGAGVRYRFVQRTWPATLREHVPPHASWQQRGWGWEGLFSLGQIYFKATTSRTTTISRTITCRSSPNSRSRRAARHSREGNQSEQDVLRSDLLMLKEERFVTCKGKGQLALAIEAADVHNRTTSICR